VASLLSSVSYRKRNPTSKKPSGPCRRLLWVVWEADGYGWSELGSASSFLLFLRLRIRKVWQKRKCGVKYGCLTISHSTVRSSDGLQP